MDLGLRAAKRRMLVVVNPYATAVDRRVRELVVRGLSGRYEAVAVDTEAKGHASEICRRATEGGYDVVACLGGDGTVGEVVNGLAGCAIPVACLPGGSANVFAKMVGMPGDLMEATEHLLGLADRWSLRKVDLGVVNGRCFTFASGVGMDASVVRQVDSNPHLKARLGPWYFAWAATLAFTGRYLVRPPKVTVQAGGVTLDGITAVVQNGVSFTYFNDRPVAIADGRELDSGVFSACVLGRATPLGAGAIAWRALSSRARVTGHRHVSGVGGVTEMTVRARQGTAVPLQADGDYLGDVEVATYSLLPGALTVLA